MPPVVIAARIGAIGTVAGAVIGSQPQTQQQQTTTVMEKKPAPMSPEYQAALAQQQAAYGALSGMKPADMGSYNSLMEKLIASGGLPSKQQLGQAQNFAGQIFNPQQIALQQMFAEQLTKANQQAAIMGRSGDDPILKAKLAQQQTNSQLLLNAQQGALATQIGLQIPMNQFQFGQAQANTTLTAAQQALQNKMAMFNAANAIANQQAQMQANLIGATQTSSGTTTSGGGVGGAIAGGLAGLAGGLNAGASIANMAGGLPNVTFAPSNAGSLAPTNYFSGSNPFSSPGWSMR